MSDLVEFVVDTVFGILHCVDLVIHWRSSLCFAVGTGLTVITGIKLSHPPLNIIAGVIIFVSFLVIGWRWEKQDSRTF